MKDKKFQVFVSSTYTDLKEERQAAVEAILTSGHIPAGMELFSAGDESQMTVIERWIDESDIYLLILGGRYGSIDSKSNKSYTELEYEYALKKGKPLFAVVITENAIEKKIMVLGKGAIEQDNPHKLKQFKINVEKNLVRYWDDYKDIKLAILETISEFSYRKDLVGWIRGDNAVNTGALAEEIARLTKENFDLRNRLNEVTSGSSALYAGLSYTQLEELLKRQIVHYDEKDINLLEFLLQNGDSISSGVGSGTIYRAIYNKLILYKLIFLTKDDAPFMQYVYRFTEDGHNFYLKLLWYSKEVK